MEPWTDALKHRSAAPSKVTRVEREIALAERPAAMSPEVALAYSSWMLASDRGWHGGLDGPHGTLATEDATRARGSRAVDAPSGSLTGVFAYLVPGEPRHARPALADELAARRGAHPPGAERRTATAATAGPREPSGLRLAARRLPGHHAGLSPEQSEAQLDEVLALVRDAGSGAALPETVAARMEAELGHSFAHVRIHLDAAAAEACAQLGAQAFTLGNHIYFGAGQFAPDSDDGAGLLRHELTHVVQHARGELTSQGGAQLVSSSSAVEVEARAAEAPRPRPSRAMPAWAGGSSERAEPHAQPDLVARAAGVGSAAAPGAMPRAAAPSPGGDLPAAGSLALAEAPNAAAPAAQGPAAALSTVVTLTGTFAPPAKVAAHLAKAGEAGAGVKVVLPGLTRPAIITVKRVEGRYVTVEDKPQLVPLSHPLFVRAGSLAPMLRIRIDDGQDNAVTGYVTTGAGDLSAMQSALQGNLALLGLRGFAVPALSLTNRLSDGKLTFGTNGDVDFTLGGWVHGSLSLAMEGKKVSFAARAALHARGIKDAEIVFARDAKGKITGSAALSAELGPHFSGSLAATYANGDVAIRGQLGYQSEKLHGKLNVLFADAAQAEEMARGELPPDAVLTESPGGAAPTKGGKQRGLAGSGTLDFAFSDWLTGSAKAVFGPTGHLTVVGKIAPPKSVELMKPKSRKVTLLPKVRLEACYGIPKLLDIHVGVAIGLDAYGVLGPIYMTDLELDGIYSTDPKVMNRFALTGTVRAQAEAGLQLSLDGYAGLNVAFHSINFGASAWARAALQAYAEARATLGYREKGGPAAGKKGEYYLQGHLEMAAQPVLSFGGGLFVEVAGPLVDQRWDWPLGSMQYPLPGQFGIAADVDYVIGSGQSPNFSFEKPAFNASKFTEQLMDGKLPKGGGGRAKPKGKFESKTSTKPTQTATPAEKKQKPKEEITAGDPKTKRTTGNQTAEEKKGGTGESKDAAAKKAGGESGTGDSKNTATNGKDAKTGTGESKNTATNGKDAKTDTGERQGNREKVTSNKNRERGQNAKKPKKRTGDETKHADNSTAGGDTRARDAMSAAKRELSALAHRAKTNVFSEQQLRSATSEIKNKHRLDGLTLTRITNQQAKDDTANTHWKVKFSVNLGVSAEARKVFHAEPRGTQATKTGTLKDSLQIVATRTAISSTPRERSDRRYLGAKATGVGQNFKGSFGHREWNWDGYPSGPVTRHPANEFLSYRNYGDLSLIKPQPIAYTYIGGNSSGAIAGDKDRWTKKVDERLRQLEFQESRAAEANGKAQSPGSESDEKKNTSKSGKAQFSNEITARAQRRLLAWYQKGYPGLIDMDDVYLKGNGARQWQAHHIHEHSWGGRNVPSNFQYLPRPEQHQEFTNWWEGRKELIRSNLFPEEGQATSSQRSPTSSRNP
ncbi:MAG: DUF4157 domain-containing protein [Kofleriaceae bacterium]